MSEALGRSVYYCTVLYCSALCVCVCVYAVVSLKQQYVCRGKTPDSEFDSVDTVHWRAVPCSPPPPTQSNKRIPSKKLVSCQLPVPVPTSVHVSISHTPHSHPHPQTLSFSPHSAQYMIHEPQQRSLWAPSNRKFPYRPTGNYLTTFPAVSFSFFFRKFNPVVLNRAVPFSAPCVLLQDRWGDKMVGRMNMQTGFLIVRTGGWVWVCGGYMAR